MTADAIYLDWNATAPLRPEARAAWLAAQDEDPGNPSSTHALGQRARLRWDRALAELATLLGCRAHELVLTGSGSEAVALGVHSALHERPGPVVASRIEHSSVLRNLAAHRDAGDLRLVEVDGDGRITPEALAAALTAETRLVCLHDANNELGTLQDLAALSAVVRARAPAAAILVDACQGVGKRALDLAAWDCDYVAFAGHKFGAPRGVGALVARTGRRVVPLVAGGRQQEDRRSGTEDVAGACALVAALRAALGDLASTDTRQADLLARTFERIRARAPQARWIAHAAPRLSNTLSLAHPGVSGEALVARLDLAGIAVSRASACMARSGQPSHVIAALGLAPELARSVIRVSIGPGTTAKDLEAFAEAYVAAVGGDQPRRSR